MRRISSKGHQLYFDDQEGPSSLCASSLAGKGRRAEISSCQSHSLEPTAILPLALQRLCFQQRLEGSDYSLEKMEGDNLLQDFQSVEPSSKFLLLWCLWQSCCKTASSSKSSTNFGTQEEQCT